MKKVLHQTLSNNWTPITKPWEVSMHMILMHVRLFIKGSQCRRLQKTL